MSAIGQKHKRRLVTERNKGEAHVHAHREVGRSTPSLPLGHILSVGGILCQAHALW